MKTGYKKLKDFLKIPWQPDTGVEIDPSIKFRQASLSKSPPFYRHFYRVSRKYQGWIEGMISHNPEMQSTKNIITSLIKIPLHACNMLTIKYLQYVEKWLFSLLWMLVRTQNRIYTTIYILTEWGVLSKLSIFCYKNSKESC